MIELTKVKKENKFYVNDEAVILDKDTITASELLELAGFSFLAYNIYFESDGHSRSSKKKQISKPIAENRKMRIETGMQFNAALKEK